MKKLIGMIIAIVMLATLAMPTFAASSDPVENETKILTTESSNDVIQSMSEVNSDKATKADKAAFKGQFKDLFDQLNGLRATASKNWETLKGINANTKTAMTAYKNSLKGMTPEERKAKAEAMQAVLKPLHATVKTIHTDIKNLRSAKKTEWENFHNAIKAKDKTAAETALKAIISLKSQIIEKQRPLMDAKNQILAALTAK